MIIDDLHTLQRVYQALQLNGVVRSKSEFSRRFLGCHASYLRSMWSRQRRPSPNVMAHLEWVLQREVSSYSSNPHLGYGYAVSLNAAYECLVQQLSDVRGQRLTLAALSSIVPDNDNKGSPPNSSAFATSSRPAR
jgi:hypothetical protein